MISRKGDAVSSADVQTILVVDDDSSVLTLVKVILEAQGYRVLLAAGAESALLLAQQRHLAIHLVLTDVVMPGMTGPALAKRLMAVRPGIRVLFMSAYLDSEIVQINVLDKGLGFVAKPFKADGLIEKIRSALSAPGWQRSAASHAALRMI
jgi:two-component system cell cycle sensor histidine kinase/response regulator CckA